MGSTAGGPIGKVQMDMFPGSKARRLHTCAQALGTAESHSLLRGPAHPHTAGGRTLDPTPRSLQREVPVRQTSALNTCLSVLGWLLCPTPPHIQLGPETQGFSWNLEESAPSHSCFQAEQSTCSRHRSCRTPGMPDSFLHP